MQYWKDQQEKYLTKLPAWSHEQEYRLLMNDSFHQHTEAERYVGYDPAILEGVIFGIKTSEADKMQISEPCENLWRKQGGTEGTGGVAGGI